MNYVGFISSHSYFGIKRFFFTENTYLVFENIMKMYIYSSLKSCKFLCIPLKVLKLYLGINYV